MTKDLFVKSTAARPQTAHIGNKSGLDPAKEVAASIKSSQNQMPPRSAKTDFERDDENGLGS